MLGAEQAILFKGKKTFFPLESVIYVFIVLLTVLNCATLKEGIVASKIKPSLLVFGNESHRGYRGLGSPTDLEHSLLCPTHAVGWIAPCSFRWKE